MKKLLSPPIVVIIFLLCINLPPFIWITSIITEEYSYSNYNGEFRDFEMPFKGRRYDGVETRFTNFTHNHKTLDKKLYRTFTLKPWRFWEWHQWATEPKRFLLPFISTKSINKNRIAERLKPL